MRLPFSRTLKDLVKIRSLNPLFKGWSFSNDRRLLLSRNYPDLNFNYVPVDLAGKTVLDVGAGEGETALFFLHKGASKVVCVEADKTCFKNLIANSKKFPLTLILEPFKLKHLKIPHDFLKVDIEGYEESLLDVTLDKPAVIELHGLQLRDRFKSKGYIVLKSMIEPTALMHAYATTCTSYAFWKCNPKL